MIEKMKDRGYTFSEHAIPVYFTRDMDRTAKWLADVLGLYAGTVKRDENGDGTYGCVTSYPGELISEGIGGFDGIFLFPGDPIQGRWPGSASAISTSCMLT